MKKITVGIAAHVDAGKTTLSEALLYKMGAIRNMGRVDHKDTLLDNFAAERERGITIFSKQAYFMAGDTRVTLLDTPGHVDFAAEMERTLQVLDYCILVIGGMDKVQGHTKTLWKLLEHYGIPAFIFINKMDQNGADREIITDDIKKKLNGNFVCFDEDVLTQEETMESIALCSEKTMEQYLDGHTLSDGEIAGLIKRRELFPVFSGSALKLTGIDSFVMGLSRFTKDIDSSESEFGARVYKITRDSQGNRETHIKVTSGVLKVRDVIQSEEISEKVNQIRIYQGDKYETVNEADAGTICAVTGLSKSYAGEGLGCETNAKPPVLQAVLNYRMEILTHIDAATLYPKLLALMEEDPQLLFSWNEKTASIEARLMGEVQTEIIKDLIKERFNVDIAWGRGSIVYRETIKNAVEGVGHFEPLRHYAEVHLLLEPSEPGSGLMFASDVSEDALNKNWQRLILTHLSEKEHIGVLTGSPVTDMKITLVNGKAHIKHTEGGDFRQATYRAVRHGLMKAESVLLEPYYSFTLLVPSENVGRALTDLDGMKAQFKPPVTEETDAVITGIAPVLLLNEYQKELRGYTHGKGSITLEFYGYMPCHNTEEVISEIGYNPELDTDNPCSSVFCAHGAGFVVDWTMVEDYMHLPNISDDDNSEAPLMMETMPQSRSFEPDIHEKYQKISYSDDRELQEIFRRTYGEAKKKTKEAVVYGKETKRSVTYEKKEKLKEYLLVDGYNVIHANPELEALLKDNLEASRSVLMDVLCNYRGYRDYEVILVFDAYRVKGNPGDVIKYHNISVVYTKEAETADRYIERTAHEIAHKYNVTVVTSDGVEQVIIRGAGCNLMSSRDFWDDVKRLAGEIHETIDKKVRNRPFKERNYLFDYLDDETFKIIEDIRLKG